MNNFHKFSKISFLCLLKTCKNQRKVLFQVQNLQKFWRFHMIDPFSSDLQDIVHSNQKFIDTCEIHRHFLSLHSKNHIFRFNTWDWWIGKTENLRTCGQLLTSLIFWEPKFLRSLRDDHLDDQSWDQSCAVQATKKLCSNNRDEEKKRK